MAPHTTHTVIYSREHLACQSGVTLRVVGSSCLPGRHRASLQRLAGED